MADEFKVAIRIKVRFRDVDMLGHVNNAVYLTYLEEARMHYYRAVMAETKMKLGSFILASVTIHYRAPAFLGEDLDVAVRVAELRTSSLVYAFRIAGADGGRVVADGTTTLVSYDYAEGKAVEMPDDLRETVCAFEGLPRCRPVS
jgi:acyl-CoA thioester hydrolase